MWDYGILGECTEKCGYVGPKLNKLNMTFQPGPVSHMPMHSPQINIKKYSHHFWKWHITILFYMYYKKTMSWNRESLSCYNITIYACNFSIAEPKHVIWSLLYLILIYICWRLLYNLLTYVSKVFPFIFPFNLLYVNYTSWQHIR